MIISRLPVTSTETSDDPLLALPLTPVSEEMVAETLLLEALLTMAKGLVELTAAEAEEYADGVMVLLGAEEL